MSQLCEELLTFILYIILYIIYHPSYCTFKMEDLTKLIIFGAQLLHIEIIF